MVITSPVKAASISTVFRNRTSDEVTSSLGATTNSANAPIDSFVSSRAEQNEELTLSEQLRKLSYSNNRNSTNFRPAITNINTPMNYIQGNSSPGKINSTIERTQFAGGPDLPTETRTNTLTFGNPGRRDPASKTYQGIYNDYAPRFVPHPGHDNNILYPGPNKGGLEFFGHLMHRASESVETNQEFLDVMQALFIPDSAIKANHYPLTKSKLQGDNYAISPGMDGWDATWREGNMDQSHHLMAFVLTGYGHQNTPSVATAKSDLLERYDSIKNGRRFNIEDARLGDMGSDYGSLLGYNENRCGSGKKWPSEKAYRKHWIDSLVYRLGRKSTYRD